MKQPTRIFVSYAHNNMDLSKRFIAQFVDYVKPSKTFDFTIWKDLELRAGEKWDAKISEEINKCDCGLLLLSTAFLNSKYIIEKELPVLLNNKKIVIPVLLQKVDFERHDLKGLENYQIFRYIDDGFKTHRSYGELKGKRREDFIAKLYVELEDRLKMYFNIK